MTLGQTTGAAFLFINLMSRNSDFLVCRLGFEFGWNWSTRRPGKEIVGFNSRWNESFWLLHL